MQAHEAPPLEGTAVNAQTVTRIGSFGLIVLGLLLLGRGSVVTPYMALPLAPLDVPDALAESDRLSWEAGELSGANVLLVTLDTTRPDRLSAYGNRQTGTPHFDRLARHGALFSNAVAVASTTLPAHASLLTGLYPDRHGARANGLYRLSDEHSTLAEILREAGYATGAFVSTFALSRSFGLAQGFDVYDDDSQEVRQEYVHAERRGDRTTERALEWLRARRREAAPFFAWVHYYDPHVPYAAPEAFAAAAPNSYDAEIAFTDAQLGQLIEALPPADERETLIVVTADHGEALGEQGEWTHGFLAGEATLRIPLVVARTRATRADIEGRHLRKRISQVDILPTVLGSLGIESADGVDGADFTDEVPGDRAVWAEAAHGFAYYGWAPLRVAYRGDHKLVEGPSPALYDLRADPLERNDRLADPDDEDARSTATRLRETLRALPLERPRSDAERTELGADEIRRLEALGYLVGAANFADSVRPATGSGARPDPARMLPVMNELLEIVTAPSRASEMTMLQRLATRFAGHRVIRDQETLVRELEALSAEHPDFAAAYHYLADAYRAVGRSEEAKRALANYERLRR